MNLVTLGMANPEILPGGLDVYRAGLERELAHRGHSVGSVVLAEHGRAGQRLFSTRQAALEAYRCIVPELVACHFAYTGMACMLTPLRAKPWVVHFQGPWAEESRMEGGGGASAIVKRGIELTVYRNAERIFVLSNTFADIVASKYRVSERKIHMVPAAVDTERYQMGDRNRAREVLGMPKDRFIVLTVRRLARRMGLERILDAVREDGSKERLWLIGGSGALANELSERILSQDLGDRVRLLGRIPDDLLPFYYQAADVFLLPSMALEGFGLVLLESLASGTPVLATSVGGVPEVLTPYAPDSLIPASSGGRELLERVRALQAGTLRLPEGIEARRFVLKRYTWEIAADSVEKHYRKVVAGS